MYKLLLKHRQFQSSAETRVLNGIQENQVEKIYKFTSKEVKKNKRQQKEGKTNDQKKFIRLIFLLAATWIISAVCAFPYYRMRRADNFQICNFAFILFLVSSTTSLCVSFGCIFVVVCSFVNLVSFDLTFFLLFACFLAYVSTKFFDFCSLCWFVYNFFFTVFALLRRFFLFSYFCRWFC